jgi:hypothetical protein
MLFSYFHFAMLTIVMRFFFIGETPVKLSSDNPEIEIKVRMLKAKYTCGGT